MSRKKNNIITKILIVLLTLGFLGITLSGSAFGKDGKSLYKANCSGKKCHKLYDPGDYTAKQWEKIVAKMASQTDLDDDELDSVLDYLKAGAKK